MRIVRCIGKALGFKADGATTRIHSAMHAREARQIIAGVHDKPLALWYRYPFCAHWTD